MAERRKYPRADIMLMYDVRNEGKGWSEKLANISTGGLRFRTDRGYNLDTHVEVEMSHEMFRSSNPMRATGRVVRTSHSYGVYDVAYEVAIEFTDLSEDARTALNRAVSSQASGSFL